jgi:hypothetical protein
VSPRLVYPAAGAAWLAVATALGVSGRTAALAPPAPQIVLVALTVALVAAGSRVPSFRAWLLAPDLRAVIAVHLTRLVGFYFLVLHRRGELPFAFAVPGGIGDAVVALTAVAWLVAPAAPEALPRLLAAWNLFGLIDILFVVVTAARLAIADPASMQALLRLPLSLLPTCIVPWIIASHLLVSVRLRRAAAAVS